MGTTRMVGLGDSTTAGTPGFRSPVEAPPDGRGNVESQYSYWMMQLHPEWTVLNKGVNGERSDQIFSRFQHDVVREEAKVVIILAGVNDIFQGRTATYVERNLKEMYGLAKRAGVVVVGTTVLPYNISGSRESSAIREVNAWVEETSKAGGLLFCDTNLAVRDPDDPDRLASTPDGLHPDVQGYKKMGEAISAALSRYAG